MDILITGGFGNVGRSAVNACLAAGHNVAIFESPAAARKAGGGLRRLSKEQWAPCTYAFGDIRSKDDVARAFALFPDGPDAVIHLAALIPPASDRNPETTREINVGGTANVIAACAAAPKKPRLVLASSIATYGDRLAEYWIRSSDPLKPSDVYSRTKVECESLLRASGIDFAVLRLSYVVWAKWLPFDPLLFSMPPATHLEVVHTEDAGRAFAAAAVLPEAGGETFDIGGGASCRTFFRAYIDRLFRYFGLGDSSFLPDSAFAASEFHCGWYEDSDYAESVLAFRRKTLEDYYEEVRWETRFLRPLAGLARPAIKRWLRGWSPFYKAPRRRAGAGSPARLQLSRQGKP